MATTSITLKDFNLQKALNGHTIALSKEGVLANIIYNFKKTTASGYTGNDGEGNDYYFNAAGECSDSTKGNLKLVSAEASKTSGTTGVRGADKEEITIEDFEKIDLRVVKVLECEPVKKAKKLLKLKVDLNGEERQVISGIAMHYKPEE